MSTTNDLTIPPTGGVPSPGKMDATPTEGLELSDILSRVHPMGFRFRIKTPFKATYGPVPICAIRVMPQNAFPNLAVSAKLQQELTGKVVDKMAEIKVGLSEFSELKEKLLPIRTFNSVEIDIYGNECPLSLFSKSCRFWRADMEYYIRYGAAFASSGIVMATVARGIPITDDPLVYAGTNGGLADGGSINSMGLCDISKNREFKLVVPYEHDTQYQDYWHFLQAHHDMAVNKSPRGISNGITSDWLILYARTDIIHGTNLAVDMYVDVRATNYSFKTPMFPTIGLISPSGGSISTFWVDDEKGAVIIKGKGTIRLNVPPVNDSSLVEMPTRARRSAVLFDESSTDEELNLW